MTSHRTIDQTPSTLAPDDPAVIVAALQDLARELEDPATNHAWDPAGDFRTWAGSDDTRHHIFARALALMTTLHNGKQPLKDLYVKDHESPIVLVPFLRVFFLRASVSANVLSAFAAVITAVNAPVFLAANGHVTAFLSCCVEADKWNTGTRDHRIALGYKAPIEDTKPVLQRCQTAADRIRTALQALIYPIPDGTSFQHIGDQPDLLTAVRNAFAGQTNATFREDLWYRFTHKILKGVSHCLRSVWTGDQLERNDAGTGSCEELGDTMEGVSPEKRAEYPVCGTEKIVNVFEKAEKSTYENCTPYLEPRHENWKCSYNQTENFGIRLFDSFPSAKDGPNMATFHKRSILRISYHGIPIPVLELMGTVVSASINCLKRWEMMKLKPEKLEQFYYDDKAGVRRLVPYCIVAVGQGQSTKSVNILWTVRKAKQGVLGVKFQGLKRRQFAGHGLCTYALLGTPLATWRGAVDSFGINELMGTSNIDPPRNIPMPVYLKNCVDASRALYAVTPWCQKVQRPNPWGGSVGARNAEPVADATTRKASKSRAASRVRSGSDSVLSGATTLVEDESDIAPVSTRVLRTRPVTQTPEEFTAESRAQALASISPDSYDPAWGWSNAIIPTPRELVNLCECVEWTIDNMENQFEGRPIDISDIPSCPEYMRMPPQYENRKEVMRALAGVRNKNYDPWMSVNKLISVANISSRSTQEVTDTNRVMRVGRVFIHTRAGDKSPFVLPTERIVTDETRLLGSEDQVRECRELRQLLARDTALEKLIRMLINFKYTLCLKPQFKDFGDLQSVGVTYTMREHFSNIKDIKDTVIPEHGSTIHALFETRISVKPAFTLHVCKMKNAHILGNQLFISFEKELVDANLDKILVPENMPISNLNGALTMKVHPDDSNALLHKPYRETKFHTTFGTNNERVGLGNSGFFANCTCCPEKALAKCTPPNSIWINCPEFGLLGNGLPTTTLVAARDLTGQGIKDRCSKDHGDYMPGSKTNPTTLWLPVEWTYNANSVVHPTKVATSAYKVGTKDAKNACTFHKCTCGTHCLRNTGATGLVMIHDRQCFITSDVDPLKAEEPKKAAGKRPPPRDDSAPSGGAGPSKRRR